MEADATLAQRQEPDRAAFIEQATRSSVYFAFGSAAIGPAAGILMASGILLFGLRILGNTETRFVQVLAVVSHAALPACIYMLLAIPVLLLKPPDTIEFENILPLTNLGFLFSPTGQHWAYAVASSLDLFSLWILALLTASVARLANWSRGLAFALTIFPWAGYVLLKGLFG
jgi:hypothetical protein